MIRVNTADFPPAHTPRTVTVSASDAILGAQDRGFVAVVELDSNKYEAQTSECIGKGPAGWPEELLSKGQLGSTCTHPATIKHPVLCICYLLEWEACCTGCSAWLLAIMQTSDMINVQTLNQSLFLLHLLPHLQDNSQGCHQRQMPPVIEQQYLPIPRDVLPEEAPSHSNTVTLT